MNRRDLRLNHGLLYFLIFFLLVEVTFFSACKQKPTPLPQKAEIVTDGSTKATNCECRIFSDGSFTWDGQVSNGYADGEGVINWTKTSERYIGTVIQGRITGQGSRFVSEMLLYRGDWLDGKYSGNGIQYFNKNRLYEGAFLDGDKSGEGTLFYEDGNISFKGTFKNNNPNGFGEKYDLNGLCIRKGYFVDGKYRDEEEVRTIMSIVARNVVKEVFNGGQKIESDLIAAKYNEDKSEKELIIDLRFIKFVFGSRQYVCRVICRNHYPEIEFLSTNTSVELYLKRNKILNSFLGEKSYTLFE